MDDHAERALLRRVTWRLIPFLFVLYMVAYLDRANVGFAQIQMKAAVGISDRVYGFGAGIFFLGYFLFEVPSNLILERVGARVWIARIMVTWGVIAMTMVFAHSALTFCALRFLLGVAEAGFFPGIILYLTYWFTAAERARIVATFMTATALANVLGSPVSGALLGIHGWGLMGWQWLFVLEGLPAVLLAFVVLAWMDNGPRQARWLTSAEKAWLVGRLAAENRRLSGRHATLREALINPAVWLLGLLYFLLVMAMYGVVFWLPQVIKAFSHVSNLQAGLLTSAPYIGAAAGMVLIGRHSDLTGERRLHVAIPALVGCAGLVASAALLHTPWAAFLALCVAAVAMWGTLGPFWTMPSAFLGGTAAAGGIALVNSIGNLGGWAGPYLVGYIKDATHNYTGGLLLLSGALLLGCLLALTMRCEPVAVVKVAIEEAAGNPAAASQLP